MAGLYDRMACGHQARYQTVIRGNPVCALCELQDALERLRVLNQQSDRLYVDAALLRLDVERMVR